MMGLLVVGEPAVVGTLIAQCRYEPSLGEAAADAVGAVAAGAASGAKAVGETAADAVGAQPILVLTGKGEKTLRAGNFPKHTVIYPDLAFAAAALLAGE